MHMREQHRRDRQDHRAELGAMLAMSQESVRDRFMEHGQELEDRQKPRTAEQRRQDRRDRAEARGTMPAIVDSDRMRGRSNDKAENLPVEGHEAGTDKTTPENEQAPTAPPEAAQEQNLQPGAEPAPAKAGEGEAKPKTGWESAEERQAAINAERERQEAQDREYERDRDNDDPGRTFEP
jgi:hypothetical protein